LLDALRGRQLASWRAIPRPTGRANAGYPGSPRQIRTGVCAGCCGSRFALIGWPVNGRVMARAAPEGRAADDQARREGSCHAIRAGGTRPGMTMPMQSAPADGPASRAAPIEAGGSLPGETDRPLGGLPILEGAGRGLRCGRAYCRQRMVELGGRPRAAGFENGRGRWLTG
jgi:hypothetical protein